MRADTTAVEADVKHPTDSGLLTKAVTFSAWAEIFGDAVAVEAMVDRLVHQSHIITLKGDSYRLKDRHDQIAATNDTHQSAQNSTGANRAEFNRR